MYSLHCLDCKLYVYFIIAKQLPQQPSVHLCFDINQNNLYFVFNLLTVDYVTVICVCL